MMSLRRGLPFLLFGVLTINACVVGTPAVIPTSTPVPTPTLTPTPTSIPTPMYPDFFISYGRGLTLGPLPIYGLKIDANGNVTYFGERYVGVKRPTYTKISPQQVEELVAAVQKAHIWDMKEWDGMVLTGRPVDLTVTLNGRTERVRHQYRSDCTKNDALDATAALCELDHKIEAIGNLDQWVTPEVGSSPTATISSARVVVTVFMDKNKDGTPQPSEALGDIPVELISPDGKVFSATTTAGQAEFDMSGSVSGIQMMATLPGLYRSYRFYLPPSGTVPIQFSFAHP